MILGVTEVDDVGVTFDRELHGTQLQERLAVEDAAIPNDVAEGIVECLRGLASVEATDHMRALPILDETQPFWQGSATFAEALTAFLERKVSVHGPLLRQHVTDFDRKYDDAGRRLGYVADARHGDPW